MRVAPLDDRVLVRPFDAEEVTPGGIVLPDVAKEKSQFGEVLEVGPGRMLADGSRAAVAVTVGDTILFSKYAGTEMKVAGEKLQMMRESEILGVYEDGAP